MLWWSEFPRGAIRRYAKVKEYVRSGRVRRPQKADVGAALVQEIEKRLGEETIISDLITICEAATAFARSVSDYLREYCRRADPRNVSPGE